MVAEVICSWQSSLHSHLHFARCVAFTRRERAKSIDGWREKRKRKKKKYQLDTLFAKGCLFFSSLLLLVSLAIFLLVSSHQKKVLHRFSSRVTEEAYDLHVMLTLSEDKRKKMFSIQFLYIGCVFFLLILSILLLGYFILFFNTHPERLKLPRASIYTNCTRTICSEHDALGIIGSLQNNDRER